MDNCCICGSDLYACESFKIKNVPSATFTFSEKIVDLNIVECKRCGAVQLQNVPLSEDYDVVYRSIGISSYREEKKEQLKNLILKYNLFGTNCLEVGCGDGQYLEIFRELGIVCDGIEKGYENYTSCINKGFLVFGGNLSEYIDDKYDTLFSFYFLEHTPTPNILISNMYEILNPGGICVVEVPNYDQIEKENIWLEFTKDHRIYFRKRTLQHLFLRNGFEIEEIQENSNLCLTIIARKPFKNTFEKMKESYTLDIQKLKNQIDLLQNDFCVYGAGHYSQLMLNQLYYEYKISPKYIFDSNPQKCGNHINGVKIHHKDEITNICDCKNVIIICGIYNDEVEKMLLSMHIKETLKLENIIKWN